MGKCSETLGTECPVQRWINHDESIEWCADNYQREEANDGR